MGDFLQDVRFAARMLRKNPGFTVIAVFTLALGIGANTSIFTMINAVMLKSLPVQNPEQLVLFSDGNGEGTSTGDPPTGEWSMFSYPVYEYFRDHNESFQGLCAFRSGEAHLSVRREVGQSGGAPERARGHLVSGNYFEVLGVSAVMGRTIASEDDTPTARPAAVISYNYWKQTLNSDPSIVGKSMALNGTPFTVVGVAPPEFFGERVRRSPDFWMPLAFQPQIELQESALTKQDMYWLNMMGRLKPGVGIEQAQAQANVALHQFLVEQAGATPSEDRLKSIENSYISLLSGAQGISGLRYYYSQPLHMLMAIVGLVLLIACANVGNLLLARASARQMEILIRLALGASRARLVRQLLTESVLLAILGGIAGILLAQWGVSVLVALVARTSPIDVSPDWLVLGFTLIISLLAGLVFGIAPALRASRADISGGLKDKSARVGGGRSRFGLAPMLVVSQVALSLVLLVGAGLFSRSLMALEREDLGFNRDNVLLLDLDSRAAGYKPAELETLYRQILDRVGGLPGVQSATLATFSPMSGTNRSSNISIQGYAPQPDEDMVVRDMLVGPRYAETLGLPVRLGREIGPQDTPASPQVAVVNEAFADHFFNGQNPVGQRFRFGDDPDKGNSIEIVGVIRDAKYGSAKEKPDRTAYRPILQVQDGSAYSSNLEIRTSGDPLQLASEVRSIIAQIDDKLPVEGITSLSDQIEQSFRQERLVAQLVSFFGLLALVLASIGLYGVMAQAVARRTNEIGIRMALGAQQGNILWMVLRETLLLVLAGIAIGVPVALLAARVIESQLFGMSPADPLTILLATTLLTVVAALAGYIPARRATKIDPMVALRYE